MLSYRHGYHAGNHADVLKHTVLVACLRYLTRKDKALWVIDTHAGAGMYSLQEGFATKLAEHREGIARIWPLHDAPSLVADYLGVVRGFNPDGQLRRYPGSPAIAAALTRDQDRLRLFELHGNESRVLHEQIADRRVIVDNSDGLKGLKALLPPPPRRALVLIDPSYELREDYDSLITTLQDALRRFPGGTYAIWYPLLARSEARQLPEQLRALGASDWLDVSLSVAAEPVDGIGMWGSGMFLINPPYTLAQALRETLPWLCQALQQDGAGRWVIAEQTT